MEKVFINRMSPRNVASITGNRTGLRALLERAAAQAAQTDKAILACLVLPSEANDPLRVFRALACLYPGTCSYWEQPARQVALVGAGTALSIQCIGTDRFTEAALTWQRLRTEAIVHSSETAEDGSNLTNGPALLGGFSFDPLRARTALWSDFPDGLLVLPRLLFRQQEEQSSLIISCQVQASDNLDVLTNELDQEVVQFAELMASLPDVSETMLTAKQAYPLRDVWSTHDWKNLVAQTVSLIQQDAFAKVVLAREVEVTSEAQERPFHLATTLQRLRLNYPAANVFAFQRGERTFVGATPERLAHAQHGQLHTMALAGSAPRGTSAEEDRQLGSSLLHSPKNRAEHAFVTEMLRASLAHLCAKTWIADTPELLRLKNIQHLQTAIVGELLPGRSILDALYTLHPTPAVGGTPTEPALAFIRTHEHLDRGWYAGPIGWIDLQGNGEFAVALRSALLERHKATLFAGCGIVKDSDPEAEYIESCLKLQVILRSLSGEE